MMQDRSLEDRFVFAGITGNAAFTTLLALVGPSPSLKLNELIYQVLFCVLFFRPFCVSGPMRTPDPPDP